MRRGPGDWHGESVGLHPTVDLSRTRRVSRRRAQQPRRDGRRTPEEDRERSDRALSSRRDPQDASRRRRALPQLGRARRHRACGEAGSEARAPYAAWIGLRIQRFARSPSQSPSDRAEDARLPGSVEGATVSHEVAQMVMREWRVPSARVSVVHNGVRVPIARSGPRGARTMAPRTGYRRIGRAHRNRCRLSAGEGPPHDARGDGAR